MATKKKTTKRVKSIKTQYTKEQLKAMIDDEAYKVGYAKGYHAALANVRNTVSIEAPGGHAWFVSVYERMTKRIKKIGF